MIGLNLAIPFGGRKVKVVEDILTFWLDEVGPRGWYTGSQDLDDTIRQKFEVEWQKAMAGNCGLWLTNAQGALAFIILTDQFSRNMFRDDPRAFAADKSARAAAKIAVDRKWDMKISEPARQFFYMPLMHSEIQSDQDRAIRLIHARMPESGASTLAHAKVHRDIIRKFGRFPYRNEALNRTNKADEQAFLDKGGYGAAFRAATIDS